MVIGRIGVVDGEGGVVWVQYVCRKQARGKLECQGMLAYPRPELNQHRSNRVSFHTLFGPASKTGARWLSDQKSPGHTYLDGVGTEERS